MRLKTHIKRWNHCTRCPLHRKRHKVVLYRGSIPADILFIGEAPGDSEDIIGKPFVGPAGKVLDSILQDLSVFDKANPIRYCITNVVGCIPLNTRGDTRQPHKDEIEACRPRLLQFIEIVKPRLIITLGKVPKKNLPPKLDVPLQSLIHPAALLPGRINESAREVEYTRCIFKLSDWLSKLEGE